MEHLSVLKRNKLSCYDKTWRKLKDMILSERCQSGKGYTIHDSNYMTSGKSKNMETVMIQRVLDFGEARRGQKLEHREFSGW